MANTFQNIPNASDLLSDSQVDIKENFGYLATTLGQDHQIAFGDTDTASGEGYHKVIHYVKQGANPAAIASVLQMYSKDYTPNFTGATPDTQLFTRTGAGGISQLTGNDANTDGWCWLGGILLQWGRKTGLSGSWPTTAQTLTFKDRGPSNHGIPFPNNCFAVVTSFIGPTSSSTGDISINSISTLNFVWQFSGSSGASFNGFYWVAIGN